MTKDFKNDVHWANEYEAQITELAETTIPELLVLYSTVKCDSEAEHVKSILDEQLTLLRQKSLNLVSYLNNSAPAEVYARDKAPNAPVYKADSF